TIEDIVDLRWKRRSADRRSRSCLRKKLSDRAFHLEFDQSFQLDRVFHRKLADEIVNKAVYAQAHRLRFAQASLLHVEDLFGADLTDARFVLHGVARSTDSDRRISIGPRRRINQKCV